MLRIKELLQKILAWISSQETTSVDLTTANYTAARCRFVSGTIRRYGDVKIIFMTVTATAALPAGTEFDIGTLKGLPLLYTSSFGVGVQGTVTIQQTGLVRMRPTFAIPNNANLYIKMVFLGGVLTSPILWLSRKEVVAC